MCSLDPSQLTVEKANKSDHLADCLDLTLIIDSGGKLSTRLHDKRDNFDLHIVNFLFLSSNIPSGPSYGIYISQLIRYGQCCSHYGDFRYGHKCPYSLRLEKSFNARNFVADIRISFRNARGRSKYVMVNHSFQDSLYLTCSRNLVASLFTWIFHLDLSILKLIANKSDHLADYLDLTLMIDSGGKSLHYLHGLSLGSIYT